MDKYFNNNICCRDIKKIIFDYLFQMILIKKINKLNKHIKMFNIELNHYTIQKLNGDKDFARTKFINYNINSLIIKKRMYVYDYILYKLYYVKNTENDGLNLDIYDFKTRVRLNII